VPGGQSSAHASFTKFTAFGRDGSSLRYPEITERLIPLIWESCDIEMSALRIFVRRAVANATFIPLTKLEAFLSSNI